VLDLLEEGGFGEVCTDLLSYVKYKCELCVVTRLTKDNKEEEDFVDVAPGWGEPW
jgi:hypothetical protein